MDFSKRATVLKVLQQAQAAGVVFSVYHTQLWSYELEPKDILEYIKDPTAFKAEVEGVSIPQYLAWNAYVQSFYQCTGVNKDGTPCEIRGMGYCGSAQYFLIGLSDRCSKHRDKAMMAELKAWRKENSESLEGLGFFQIVHLFIEWYKGDEIDHLYDSHDRKTITPHFERCEP